MATIKADRWRASRAGGLLIASTNANQDRLLVSEGAQRASLGSALLDNSLMRGPLASLAITDFAGTVDQTVYAQMLELSEDGEPFDPLTLAQALEERGELEQVGGIAYLGSLIDGAPD